MEARKLLKRCKACKGISVHKFSLIETKATFEAVIMNFRRNLDDHDKVLFLTDGLKLPFQCSMSESIARFVMLSVYKLVLICERLVVCGIITPNRLLSASTFLSRNIHMLPGDDCYDCLFTLLVSHSY